MTVFWDDLWLDTTSQSSNKETCSLSLFSFPDLFFLSGTGFYPGDLSLLKNWWSLFPVNLNLLRLIEDGKAPQLFSVLALEAATDQT